MPIHSLNLRKIQASTLALGLTLILAACGGGSDGAPGADGVAGPAGAVGPAGTTGPSGPAGTTGTTGVGTPGTPGTPGTLGTPGTAGTPGTPGINSLVRTTAEPAGANCPAGGVRVQSGLDTNANAVLDASEVLATSYVCNPAGTVPKTWGTAELIETDNASNAGKPQIAVDAAGNALAVWAQYDGTRNNIWANRFTPAAGWGTAVLIETDGGDAGEPQIDIDASGNAVAVWQQAEGTRFNIWANRFTTSSGWETAARIETNNAADAELPQIAMDPSGNAVAVWRQSDGTRNNIWANRFTPAAGWGTAVLIETDNAGNAFYPQIAIDVRGNAMAVWRQFDGTRDNIQANRFK